jgi:NDP-sugar pyrophosphorylase family protein
MTVRVITVPECTSFGDVMRELDAQQLVWADFLLVYGDLVSTINLNTLYQQHMYLTFCMCKYCVGRRVHATRNPS